MSEEKEVAIEWEKKRERRGNRSALEEVKVTRRQPD